MANDQPLAEIAGGTRDEKSGRYSDEHVPVVGARNMAAEDFGDYVGGERPDHHELTVSHVDHAHEPENDREPECHQDEDAGQGEAGEGVVNEANFLLIAFDSLETFANRLLELRISLRRFLQRLKRFPQAHAAIARGELAKLIYSRQFFLARAVCEMDSGNRFAQRSGESPPGIFFELGFK